MRYCHHMARNMGIRLTNRCLACKLGTWKYVVAIFQCPYFSFALLYPNGSRLHITSLARKQLAWKILFAWSLWPEIGSWAWKVSSLEPALLIMAHGQSIPHSIIDKNNENDAKAPYVMPNEYSCSWRVVPITWAFNWNAHNGMFIFKLNFM